MFRFRHFAIALFVIPVSSSLAQEKMTYPDTKQIDQVDEYWGNKVADPYRWLEDDVRTSDEVRQWVESQNEVTFAHINELPFREEIEKRLTSLWDYEKYGTPFKRGDRYFYFKNEGLQNQSVLYELPSLDAEPTELIDPNKWSEDGTVAMGGMAFSDDGKLMAYGVQDAGSDWRTWYVMNVDTKEKLNDELKWLKFGGVSWIKDGSGFFYSRYDEPNADEKFQGLNLGQKVYFHKLGDPQSEDKLIHEDRENPKWGFSPEVTEDGKYLVITVWQGTDDRYRVMYKSLEDPYSKMEVLIDNFDHEYTFLGNEGSRFYFKSDNPAPKKCVLVIDVENPERENWNVIVPEADEAMESAGIVGDYLVVQYLQDAKTQVKIFDLNGQLIREVRFPGIGSASGFGGRRDQTETFYSFSSFNRPPSIYRYDLNTGESQLIREAKVDFNPEDFVVEQVFYNSKDGTRVPMFIAYKKGLESQWQESDAAICLRRFQHLANAWFFDFSIAVDGDGRRVCHAESARRWRIR